ncbi:CxxH/CxxC protein (TIGR04129 family) [Scopulibacillus daqui]|uniref:CxxH/CxxC protein (TIGR04129 family) n=1 Tax=Scopulibacillus daqui TaxID=1469162 RepID=A0ABS2Q1T4_9BACL|nr:CxxH/CxxC protein (TIGR04129 family) [Scopulibacillus daqui]
MKRFVCLEHVELALEEVVDNYQTAPVIEKINNEKDLSTTCEYCKKTAEYIVTN